jgi:Rad3-related DNA helicase
MKWSLYNKKEYLEPFIFSNGKSQLDIAKEVIDAAKKGSKIIFIHGFCGTGKSAVALNIAKELGRTSIVVPVKTLQNQYFEDYTNKLHVKKSNNEILKISILFGRQNFKCTFDENATADNLFLPCTIDVNYKENERKLFEYAEKNPFVDANNFDSYKKVRRMSVAPACSSWSPVLPVDFEVTMLEDANPTTYEAVSGKYVYYKRGGNCPYYNQYQSYIDADVIIFNSMKYEIENTIGRKPKTEVEIIDECDEFLDNLGNEKIINLNILQSKLNFFDSKYKGNKIIPEIYSLVSEMIKKSDKFIENEEIFLLKDTKVKNLMTYFFNHTMVHMIMNDDEDYLFNVYSNLESFKSYVDETYVVFSRNKREEVIVKLIMVNLERKLKEFLDKNKVFVMMSGTIHSRRVLENIFGIKNYSIIEAETKEIGKRNKVKTGKEKEFNHIYLKKEGSREEYLRALSDCISKAKKPALIHVNAFKDLPSNYECNKYHLEIKSKEDLINEQMNDKTGEIIQKFKNKEIDILYSTKCNRGVDYPGDMCNSIIFTKFPYADRSSLFWRILSKTNKKDADIFYFDKARREIIQRSFRGVRSKDDKVDILSPDMRVLEFFG